MTRISRQQMFMEIARTVAKRSTCLRLNVGAIIVDEKNNIISMGYNGQKAGAPHCMKPCGEGMCDTQHAEWNAIERAPKSPKKIEVGGRSIYVTASPCHHCARAIHQAGISRVYFETPYRVTTGIDHLIKSNVRVFRVLPSGAMLDMKTGGLIDANEATA